MANTPDFQYQKTQEQAYARQLRKIADQASAIVNAHIDDDGQQVQDIEGMLKSAALYSEAITPWANRVAAAMIRDVARVNKNSWQKMAKDMSDQLKYMLLNTDIGNVSKMIQQRQVLLIKSIPIDAAKRVQDLARQATISGQRADEVATLLQNTTQVNRSRATLIARTEIAKTNASITQARAQSVNADKYIWRTMEDGAVRPAHQDMANDVFSFSNPPYVEGEGNHGPGDFPNCRCYAEPIIT